MCFDTVPAAFNNMMGQKIYTFMMNFLKDSLSVSISSEMVWIVFMKESISLTMFAMKTEKRLFLSYNSNGCYEKKRNSWKT